MCPKLVDTFVLDSIKGFHHPDPGFALRTLRHLAKEVIRVLAFLQRIAYVRIFYC